MHTVFETERIRFVPVSEELLSDYLAMINDYERVGKLIGMFTPQSEENERAWIRRKLEEKEAIFSMIEKASGEFIGNTEFMDVAGAVGELGIAITAAKQDKGYGSEAIPAMIRYGKDVLGLRRIFLKAYPHNARAIHVYEKCGFREYERTEKDVFMEYTGPLGK